MTVISQLATSLQRADEAPNHELAERIVQQNDIAAITELVTHLYNKNKNIQSDCIKVLYEIGERKPALIAGHAQEFIALLDNKNNRLVWGAMTALDALTPENPKAVYTALGKIIGVAEKGSVITKDHAMNILIRLCETPKYREDAFTLLLAQLKGSLPNQLPMYAEHALPVIDEKRKPLFAQVLKLRLRDVEQESKRKRIEKVLKKLGG